jgi:hypothetical protein
MQDHHSHVERSPVTPMFRIHATSCTAVSQLVKVPTASVLDQKIKMFCNLEPHGANSRSVKEDVISVPFTLV